MQDIVIRLGILLIIGITVWLLIQLCRRFIAAQRRQALATAPLSTLPIADNVVHDQPEVDHSRVRILAFSSADCRQCHQLQTPALQRAAAARGDAVTVIEVDATSQHELAETYHVLTVPSTVILDVAGQAQAINYGFANTQRLLAQIDEVLTKK
jgi:thioredoxin-like negative regulator of GroEL